jgi:hypothetical protein
MKPVKEMHAEALGHLRQAHRIMRQLTALSGDWTAGIQVREQFEYLEQDCRDFGVYQLGIGTKREQV